METRQVYVWLGEMGLSRTYKVTCLESLSPAPTMGFPPKTLLSRLGGQLTALPQPLHGDCSPLLASQYSGPQFPMGTLLTARPQSYSTSIPPRLCQRPLPPSGCPCACLPFAVSPGGPAHRSFPAPSPYPFFPCPPDAPA